ncbi:MAG: hypothetical protein J5872_01000 [Lachnospiraceae bacterium]|nr:hypothetical protein [Lachnospiraceae bacterium]
MENEIVTSLTENINAYVPEATVKVQAKSKYSMVPKGTTAGNVWGVLISVFLIFGGLSGQFVLRGTQSSTALVVVGFICLFIDIITILSGQKKQNAHRAFVRNLHKQEDEVLKNSKQLEESVPVKVVYEKSQGLLLMNPAVNGVTLKKNAKQLCYEGTVTRRRSILNFEAFDLTVVFDVVDNSEIVFTIENNKGDFSVTVPSNVTFVSDTVQVSQTY